AGTFAKVLASHLELHNNIETLQQTVDDLSTAQNQLVEQAKNAALGEMLSGLAHEVNTPLSVVGNAISLTTDTVSELKGMMLEGRLTRDGFKQWHTDANHFLDLGRQNLGRAIRIMTELKSVSLEHHVNSVEAVQLIEHVERVKLLLNPLSRSHGIEIEIEGDPVAVETSPGKLHQAIVNLIQNAAIHGYEGAGGKVSIRIARTKTGAQIQVQDYGRGMSPEIQRKALEPFFTTKRGKGGTGLGLHLTATNISEIGGRLSLDSKEGQGTTFTLLLPQYQTDRG
ncbi:MAG: sensor histidine kinase, partial [Bradymonadia bacterium]